MTDFERKNSENKDEGQLGNDPLLELTRLFGTRPRPSAFPERPSGQGGGGGQPSGQGGQGNFANFPTHEEASYVDNTVPDYQQYPGQQPIAQQPNQGVPEGQYYGDTQYGAQDGQYAPPQTSQFQPAQQYAPQGVEQQYAEAPYEAAGFATAPQSASPYPQGGGQYPGPYARGISEQQGVQDAQPQSPQYAPPQYANEPQYGAPQQYSGQQPVEYPSQPPQPFEAQLPASNVPYPADDGYVGSGYGSGEQSGEYYGGQPQQTQPQIEETEWTSQDWQASQQADAVVAPATSQTVKPSWKPQHEAGWYSEPTAEEAFINEHGVEPDQGVYAKAESYPAETPAFSDALEAYIPNQGGYGAPEDADYARGAYVEPQPAPQAPVYTPEPAAAPVQQPAPIAPGYSTPFYGYGQAVQINPVLPSQGLQPARNVAPQQQAAPPPYQALQAPLPAAPQPAPAAPPVFVSARAPAAPQAPATPQAPFAANTYEQPQYGVPEQTEPAQSGYDYAGGNEPFEQKPQAPAGMAAPQQGHTPAFEPGAGYSVDPADEGFAAALNDFDLTIPTQNDRRRRRTQAPVASRLGENQVVETESFELPDVHYNEDSAKARIDNALDQEFAGGFEVGGRPTSQGSAMRKAEDEFLAAPNYAGVANTAYVAEGGQNPDPFAEDGNDDNGIYNWGAPADAMVSAATAGAGTSRSRRKWVIGIVALFALGAFGAGIYTLVKPAGLNGNGPAIIQADPGEIKVQPDKSGSQKDDGKDPAVYNQKDGKGTQGADQSKLVDETETPVDIDAVNEQPPATNESSLDPNSLEARVLVASEQSVPIHVVPTVVVRPDGQVVNVSKPDKEATVLVPGASFREQLSNGSVTPSTRTQDDASSEPQSNTPSQAETRETPSDATLPIAQATSSVEKSGVTPPAAAHSQPDVAQMIAANNIAQQREEKLRDQGEVSSAASAPGTTVEPQASEPVRTVTPPAIIPNKPAPSVQTAAAGPAVQPQQETASAGGFFVQISSQPSEQAARESADEAKRRFASIIDGNAVVIVPAAIPGRGTYYRVRIPAGDRNAAISLCERFKEAGGSCFIGK